MFAVWQDLELCLDIVQFNASRPPWSANEQQGEERFLFAGKKRHRSIITFSSLTRISCAIFQNASLYIRFTVVVW